MDFITILNHEKVKPLQVVHYYDGPLSQLFMGEASGNNYYVMLANEDKFNLHYFVINLGHGKELKKFVEDGYKSLEYLRTMPLSLISLLAEDNRDLTYSETSLHFEDIPAIWLPAI